MKLTTDPYKDNTKKENYRTYWFKNRYRLHNAVIFNKYFQRESNSYLIDKCIRGIQGSYLIEELMEKN